MKHRLFYRCRWVAIGIAIAVGIMPLEPTQAQPFPIVLDSPGASYRTVERETALQYSMPLQVAPGRTTTLTFDTDEVIAYVLLGDSSRLVYTLNGELGSAQTKLLFLRRIDPLDFPGATTTWVTTLNVQTIDATGRLRLYTFEVEPVAQPPTYVGLTITPAIPGNQTLQVGTNRRATLQDIEMGLAIAIQQGYTSASDPIVSQVRQFLALARNTAITLPEAATTTQVPLAVISELANIAHQERLRHPSAPLPETSGTATTLQAN